MRSIVEPGEPVGVLAAQSVGEPSTQVRVVRAADMLPSIAHRPLVVVLSACHAFPMLCR